MFLVKGKVSIIRKGKFSFRKQHYGNMISVFLVRTKSPFNCLREIFILETLDVGIGDFRQPSFVSVHFSSPLIFSGYLEDFV